MCAACWGEVGLSLHGWGVPWAFIIVRICVAFIVVCIHVGVVVVLVKVYTL